MNFLKKQAADYLFSLERTYQAQCDAGEINPFTAAIGVAFVQALYHSPESFTPCCFYMKSVAQAHTPKQETVIEFRCAFSRVLFNDTGLDAQMSPGTGEAEGEFVVCKVHAKPISNANIRKFIENESNHSRIVEDDITFQHILREQMALRWDNNFSYAVALAHASMMIIQNVHPKVFAPRINGFGELEWFMAFDQQLISFTVNGDRLKPEMEKMTARLEEEVKRRSNSMFEYKL